MKRNLIIVVVAIFICAWVVPAAAWEFRLKTEAEWKYVYISRTGPNDLFGNADIAQSSLGVGTSIGLAGPHFSMVRLEGYSSKGSDAAYGAQRLWFYPEFRVNPAIRLRAITSFSGNLNEARKSAPQNQHYNGWIIIDSRDLFKHQGISDLILNAAWATFTMPWGTIAIGRRPAGFGMGWAVHSEEGYARSLSLIVPYGPLTFVFSQYLHDSDENTDPNDTNNDETLMPNWTYTIGSALDQNEVLDWNQAYALVYRAANVDMGVMARIRRHSNVHREEHSSGTYRDDRNAAWFPRLFLYSTHANGSGLPLYGDIFVLLGASYFKYFNGRFFFNAEYDFQLFDVRRKGGRPISGFPQAWAVETGLLAGPMKISLAHFYRSGHDRRCGRLELSQPTGTTIWGTSYDHFEFFTAEWGGGAEVMAPYSFLMHYYGYGNNSYRQGVVVPIDLLAYATRLDYAIAANLNLFSCFMHVQRASNTGTPQGYYNGIDRGDSQNQGWFMGPNVPDNDVGYEFDVGFNWKLLEGMTLNCLFAYWQPGNWFKWAYQDMTFSDPRNNVYGTVNPGRTIDPLIAFQAGLLLEF